VATSRGACDHPYYPLRQGYRVDYRTSFNDAHGVPTSRTYSISVPESTATTAKMVTTFPGEGGGTDVTANQSIECGNGVLRTNSFVDIGSRVAGASRFTTETRHVTGDLLPDHLSVGSAWQSSFDIAIHAESGSAASAIGDMVVSVNMKKTVLAEESVTVPAGTYQALKVKTETMMLAQGIAATDAPPLVGTEWWVKGVGLVKSVIPVGAGFGDVVTEATHVNVP